MGEVCFHLIGTNGFHVKAESKRLTAVGSCSRQNLKFWKLSAEQRLCSEMRKSSRSPASRAFGAPSPRNETL